mmetsp:Transcript_5829/g.12273  ORF Transcript_5829/g.12273 Transcript_5829/m.12273 type:complete len:237 (-) Transcript_5829:87-797(-)
MFRTLVLTKMQKELMSGAARGPGLSTTLCISHVKRTHSEFPLRLAKNLAVVGHRVLVLLRLTFGLHSNKIRDAGSDERNKLPLPHRRHEKLIIKPGAVFLVVIQKHRGVLVCLERVADILHVFGLRLLALQKAAVHALDFMCAVPRELEELPAGKHNRVIWQVWIRHAEHLIVCFHLVQQLQISRAQFLRRNPSSIFLHRRDIRPCDRRPHQNIRRALRARPASHTHSEKYSLNQP